MESGKESNTITSHFYYAKIYFLADSIYICVCITNKNNNIAGTDYTGLFQNCFNQLRFNNLGQIIEGYDMQVSGPFL